MDRRFLLLLILVLVAGFAATWMFLDDSPDPADTEWAGKPVAEKASVQGPFESCDDARKAGNVPLLAGQPGYNPKLDPDGTGVACPP